MAARRQPLLEHVHRLAARLDPETDTVLLERFVRQSDEVAFEALVRRHGPMVLGVCRRVLGNDHDAEDAFQATFLVLSSKAASIRPSSSLPAWLHGVAHRLALKQRQTQKRRQNRETRTVQAAEVPPPSDPLDQLTVREMFQALDEELQRLPASYRLPLILCWLEGRTQDEAADVLGWTLPSVKMRLQRGRALLHTRLARRGLVLGGMLAVAALGQRVAAALPAGLARATVEAALRLAAGEKGGIAAGVLALAEEGMMAVRLTGMKIVTALLGLTLVVSTGGVLARQIGAQAETEPCPRFEEPGPTAESSVRPAPEGRAARVDRFGDSLPPGALARLGTVRLRHINGVKSLAFTRDGKGLITAGSGDPPRLWDVASGRMLRQFGENRDDRTDYFAALSPDGRTLAGSLEPAGNLGLWDVATGKLLHLLKGDQRDHSLRLVFSPDGKTVALGGGHALRLWETATGKELWVAKQLQVASLTYSADSKSLIWGGLNGDLHLWDAVTGKELRRWDDDEKRPVWVLSRAPNGRLFAAYGSRKGAGCLARLWDLATDQEVWQRTVEEGTIITAAFSPDGKILATGCHLGPLCLWDAATGKELRRCGGYRVSFSLSLAFAPDGKTLAAGDQAVHWWDVASGQEVRRALVGHQGTVCSVAFTPDGKDIVSGSWEGSTRVWNAITGEQRRQILAGDDERFMRGMGAITTALSPDSKTIVSVNWGLMKANSSLQIRRWDRESGRELRGWSAELGNSSPNVLVISPDGKTVASVYNGNTHRWEAMTGKELSGIAGGRPAFSPDGRLLATVPLGGKEEEANSFTLWEAATAKELCTVAVPQGRVHRLLFSPDGRMLATASHPARQLRGAERASPPSMVHLWPLAREEGSTLRVRAGPPRLLAERLRSLLTEELHLFGFGAWAFSPDGRTLAISDEGNTVRLLETASGKECGRFTGHSGDVGALAFSPDGRRLASGSRDTTLLIWDVTGRLQDGRLRSARLSAQELEACWAGLAVNDARRAKRAIWTLVSAPDQAVSYLGERLRHAAADNKTRRAKVPQLLRDLDDNDFAVRAKAKGELMRLGDAAESALRQALEQSPSVEARRSLEQLLKTLEANHHALLGESLRGMRALEVLEQIGTREARQTLKDLTAGVRTESSLTQEACASLDRLNRAERR